jgi:DNA-binding response OmpR family regulator
MTGSESWLSLQALIAAGEITLESDTGCAYLFRHCITLTRKEYGVLETLMTAQGSGVSSQDLLDRVWDENADPFTSSARVTMMTLRRKLNGPNDDGGLAGVREPRRPKPRPASDGATSSL